MRSIDWPAASVTNVPRSLGTALAPAKSFGNTTTFAQTTIRHLEDSPVLTGLYFKEIPLAPGIAPQHFLDVAADSPQDLDQNLTKAFLAALNKLVPEAWAISSPPLATNGRTSTNSPLHPHK